MEDKLFTVITCMEERDFHKFLYIATFRRSKIIIPFIFFISALMAFLLVYGEKQFGMVKFFIYWIILVFIAILVVFFKVEIKNRQRIKTDKTGVFNSQETLDFYEDFFVRESSAFEGEFKIKYDQLYQVLESKDYFINYFNVNQAFLIRKKDMGTETVERLRSLYRRKMGDKYKRI
ncbi:YcxB family protein [Thermosyntropha sp.]|uniref:YcxB family protein n=1 Tax=Thermosyntropha sp. TaxID=2740820 RepID=UPI0025EB54D5|nr:YcxB family protein [Thermosyntropha sp.]MBO8159526.1 YcxB family protein [Thermosyntropha sp.]